MAIIPKGWPRLSLCCSFILKKAIPFAMVQYILPAHGFDQGFPELDLRLPPSSRMNFRQLVTTTTTTIAAAISEVKRQRMAKPS